MNIDTIRHSLSHIMAYAVQELYPGVKFGMGPAVENGFYYDFDFSKIKVQIPNKIQSPNSKITNENLAEIEAKMRELLKQNLKFAKKNISKPAAKKLFKDQPYKLDLIKELPGKTVSVYQSGNFVDLCKGPHVKSTKNIPAEGFKLLKIAGAYWKGDEKNKMLTRIYGLAFNAKKELDDCLKLQQEAEKRDHRILGEKLGLFIFSDLVGKGLPLFTEKGAAIRRELERLVVDEEIKRGYKHVCTPDLAKVDLYKKSGHYPYYKDSMYPVMKIDEDELILRPMTCPHHYQLYLAKPRSYRELPFRIAELAKQFRYEKSGELTGLIRVRSFCLADSHIICAKEDAYKEISSVLDLIKYMAGIFGLKPNIDYRYRLSLGDKKDPKKYCKNDKAWSFAENALRRVLENRKEPFFEAKKEAAFYGPKIDIQMKNFAGKEDTAFTVQYDFVAPKRFELNFINSKGKKEEAIVIHRSSIGCIERIMAFLIEKYAGAFPVWLSPVQVALIPISQKHEEYAKEAAKKLGAEGIRYETMYESETLGKKIRGAETQKIPYILVVGDKEIETNSLAVRKRGKNNIEAMGLDDFVRRIKKEIKEKQ